MRIDEDIAALRNEMAELKRSLDRSTRLHTAGTVAAIRALGSLRAALFLIDSRMPTIGGLGESKAVLVNEISEALRDVEAAVDEVNDAQRQHRSPA